MKSLKQSKKRNLRNKTVKSRLRTEQTKFDRVLERGDVEAAEKLLDLLTKLYQQAAAKHVMHANTAARKQAQCQNRVNDAKAQASG
ncbi:MAG: 30S ribosomal protein S20 [Candidatus Brocadiae bacterium]|nr:30S ribosomal protein S20 [Candidatus Brocadiia bacterium]